MGKPQRKGIAKWLISFLPTEASLTPAQKRRNMREGFDYGYSGIGICEVLTQNARKLANATIEQFHRRCDRAANSNPTAHPTHSARTGPAPDRKEPSPHEFIEEA